MTAIKHHQVRTNGNGYGNPARVVSVQRRIGAGFAIALGHLRFLFFITLTSR